MASDNAVAKNVSAAKVYLKDNSVVENLVLTKGYRDRRPYSAFENKEDSDNKMYYIGYPPDLVLENNAVIKNIHSQRAYNNVKLICETGIPQIPANFLKENTTYYVLGKNIIYSQPLKTRYALLKDNAKAGAINAESVYLKNSSKAENIETNNLIMEDNSFVDKAFAKYDLKINGSSSCNELLVNKRNCDKRYITIGDNVRIGQLKALQTSQLTVKDNANIKKIINNHGSTTLTNNSNSESIEGLYIDMQGKSKAKNIVAQQSVMLFDNSVVENIKVLDKENPIIKISGNAKVTGKIEFPNGKGQVFISKDFETGKYPEIKESSVINGEIIKEEDLFKTVENSEVNKSPESQTISNSSKPHAELKGFAKVAGMDELKRTLYEDVIYPMTRPELYKEYGLESVNGFLLYGPPGCGKTYIAKALAEETGRYFVEMPASSVGSHYQHLTTKNIAAKFAEARRNAPSIIFIDEVEALAPARELLDGDSSSVDINENVTELLQQINNCRDKKIFIIFATNEPQKIDNAIKRTGRIDKKIFLPPPDIETRKILFSMYLDKVKRKQENIDIAQLAQKTRNYTAEDIRMVVRQASVFAMRENRNVSLLDLKNSIAVTQPSLTDSMVTSYKEKGEME